MPHRFLNYGPATEVQAVNLHTKEDEYEGFDDDVAKRQDVIERQLNDLDPVVERIKAQCAAQSPS